MVKGISCVITNLFSLLFLDPSTLKHGNLPEYYHLMPDLRKKGVLEMLPELWQWGTPPTIPLRNLLQNNNNNNNC